MSHATAYLQSLVDRGTYLAPAIPGRGLGSEADPFPESTYEKLNSRSMNSRTYEGELAQLNTLKTGKTQNVLCDKDGLLFAQESPAPAWETSASDAGNYDLGSGSGIGTPVRLTGLDMTVTEAVAAGDTFFVNLFLSVQENGGAIGDLEVGFGLGAAQPTFWIPRTVLENFQARMAIGLADEASALSQGQVISVWARRNNGAAAFALTLGGSGVAHEAEMGNYKQAGNVTGPGSSTLNGVPRYADTSGQKLADSGVTIDGSDNLVTPGNLTIGRDLTYWASNASAKTTVKTFAAANPTDAFLFRTDFLANGASSYARLLVSRGLYLAAQEVYINIRNQGGTNIVTVSYGGGGGSAAGTVRTSIKYANRTGVPGITEFYVNTDVGTGYLTVVAIEGARINFDETGLNPGTFTTRVLDDGVQFGEDGSMWFGVGPDFAVTRGGTRQLNIGSTAGSQVVRVLGSADDVGSPTNWGGLELSHTGTAGQIATANGGLGTAGDLQLQPTIGRRVAIGGATPATGDIFSVTSNQDQTGLFYRTNGFTGFELRAGTTTGSRFRFGDITTNGDSSRGQIRYYNTAHATLADTMRFLSGGTNAMDLLPDGSAQFFQNVTVGGRGLFAAGTEAAPGVSVGSGTGFYQTFPNQLDFSAGAVGRARLRDTALRLVSTVALEWGSLNTPSFGMVHGGARQLNIGSTAGSQVVRVLGSADDVGSPTNWNGLQLTHDGTRGRITVEAGGIGNQGDLWLESRGNRVAVNTDTGAPGPIEAPLHVHHTGQGVDVSTGLIIERPNGNSAVEIRGADTTIQYLRFGGQAQKGAVAPGQIQYYAASHAATPNRMLFLNNLTVFMDVDGNQRIALPGVLAQTTDPGTAGQLWNDNGTVKISSG